jgi:hypothetical protein
MSEQFSVCSVLEFKDGDVSMSPLGHDMTKEAAEKLMDIIPGVAYSGERPVTKSYLIMRPTEMLRLHVPEWFHAKGGPSE